MESPMLPSLIETGDSLEDPRVDRTKRHNRTDIRVLSVLVVLCGADSFVAIALLGPLNEEWLCTFLARPHGIPSHDTLGRVLARLARGLKTPQGARAFLHLLAENLT